MATYNINIINPVIDLIADKNVLSNNCKSIHRFTIKSSPFAQFKVEITRGNDSPEDYQYAEIDMGGGWQPYTSGDIMIMNSTGRATFRIVQGNPYLENIKVTSTRDSENNQVISEAENETACAVVHVLVTDMTNNKTEMSPFSRCSRDRPCDDMPTPQAVNDSYEIKSGTSAFFTIMDNDSSGSAYATIVPIIVSNPSHGTVVVQDNGSIKYTNNGDGVLSDSFTYKVKNNLGDVSNIATVNITVDTGVKTIDTTTRINIHIDNSASMGTTLTQLRDMRANYLKEALLPYYNNDSALYDQMVSIKEFSDERTLRAMYDGNNAFTGQVISLVFQNEAYPNYYGMGPWSPNEEVKQAYIDDFIALRNKLYNFGKDNFEGVIFQLISGEDPDWVPFSNNIESGTGNMKNYSFIGVNDYNVHVEKNVTQDAGALAYKDIIINTLNSLGFNIQ